MEMTKPKCDPKAGKEFLDRLGPGEPYFILRGRDPLAAVLVQQWANMARGGGTPLEKTDDALAIADAMDLYPTKKHPD